MTPDRKAVLSPLVDPTCATTALTLVLPQECQSAPMIELKFTFPTDPTSKGPLFLDFGFLSEDRSELFADKVSLNDMKKPSHRQNCTMLFRRVLCPCSYLLGWVSVETRTPANRDLSSLPFHVTHAMITPCNMRTQLCHLCFQAGYLPCQQTHLSLYPMDLVPERR